MMCAFDEQTYRDEMMAEAEVNTAFEWRKPSRDKELQQSDGGVEWMTLAEHEAAVTRECHAAFSTGEFLTCAAVASVLAWLSLNTAWCDLAVLAQVEHGVAYIYGG